MSGSGMLQIAERPPFVPCILPVSTFSKETDASGKGAILLSQRAGLVPAEGVGGFPIKRTLGRDIICNRP
jgi:hypothetical protein